MKDELKTRITAIFSSSIQKTDRIACGRFRNLWNVMVKVKFFKNKFNQYSFKILSYNFSKYI